MKEKIWQVTDIDNLQFNIKGTFTWKEFDRVSYPVLFDELIEQDVEEIMESSYWFDDTYWIQKEINLPNYSLKEIQSHISPYYKGLDEIVKIYETEADFIAAECIFEQESGMY